MKIFLLFLSERQTADAQRPSPLLFILVALDYKLQERLYRPPHPFRGSQPLHILPPASDPHIIYIYIQYIRFQTRPKESASLNAVCTVCHREQFMDYRGKGFLAVLLFGSFLPPLPSARCLSFSLMDYRGQGYLAVILFGSFPLPSLLSVARRATHGKTE